jgi:hypothetical protein
VSENQNASVKNRDTYDALRDKGYSKDKSAAIANAQENDHQHPSEKGGKASPYEEWTRDELYERAQELELDGRSSMDKNELIEALRQ